MIADPVAEQAYEKVLDDPEIHGVLYLTGGWKNGSAPPSARPAGAHRERRD
jgi:hypothetical protein